MTRGSKVFRPTDLPESNSSGYPEQRLDLLESESAKGASKAADAF